MAILADNDTVIRPRLQHATVRSPMPRCLLHVADGPGTRITGRAPLKPLPFQIPIY